MLSPVHTPGQKSRNLILIGFMGTGKTTIGRRVASSLGFRFVDTDERIVQRAGKPIPLIFEEDGEEAFRALETKVLGDCAAKSGQVISTGGGIVTRPENVEILGSAGFVIWLRASPDAIFERVSRNRNRPLLQTDDPLETIRRLLAEREGLYEEACDLTVATDDLTQEETSYGVTESARLALAVG